MNISSLEVFIGIILLLGAGYLISSGIETRSKFWTTIGSVLFVSIAMTLTVDYYFDNVEPVEIVKEVNYGFQEYDFGKVGITAFQDDFGTTLVVSCFQPTDDLETHCWDHHIQDEHLAR